MKKAIITGSGGFIGKALVNHLTRQFPGIKIIGIDRAEGIEVSDWFMDHDISDVACVFHLAAQTSVFNTNKCDIIRDNIEAFRIVCDVCRRSGVKFVYASSSTAEQDNTTSLYGITKRFDEQYARCYNPTATGVRFHNVYGRNPRQGTLLWHLIHDRRVRLYNRGANTRHFTYIDNITEGLLMAAYLDTPLVNVANPRECTVSFFANLVRKYHYVEIEPVDEEREMDRRVQRVNREIYTLPLRYVPVSEGIRRVFEKGWP
ncbi:MAG: SDR family oxidoreductase [Muribaculaceae bacterium]|nr:SDR family oxidoreductase [Muribaculaceae bacterium]